MTVLSVVQRVSTVIGVERPTVLFPSVNSDRTLRELADLATTMAQRIAYETREWQALTVPWSYIGDGTVEGFPLPANFKRLLLGSNVWHPTSPNQPLRYIPSVDEWLQRRMRGTVSTPGEWTIYGNLLHIQPIMRPGTTAGFFYLDKNCVKLLSGGAGDAFVNDGDSFALDERLLYLGMIWQWKANKGSPYAEDMANYQDALGYVAGADKPAQVFIDRRPMSAYARTAYPFPITLGPGGVPI